MKRIIKKTMPFMLAVVVLFQTVYSSVETAKAAALPEVIYYTYWDLISSLYGVCGYDSKIDESVINNHSVAGKQAWDNFVTFVENSAKANYKFLGDGASKVFSELENLVNNVTDKGFSITQDLYDMLKSVFADQNLSATARNDLKCTTTDALYEKLVSMLGIGEYSDLNVLENSSILLWVVKNDSFLNVARFNGSYVIFSTNRVVDWKPYIDNGITYTSNIYYISDSGREESLNTPQCWAYSTSKRIGTYNGFISGSSCEWIIKNGHFAGTDTIGAQTSAEACPAEVPEVVPWRKEITVPDEWRVIPGGGSDDDPDKNPDALPVVIPIKPSPGKDPDSTEDPSTETPEDPDKNKDPDKKKNPVVNPIINPDTGNVVDPNTGWDIDPSTGKLINPNTGKLVDPDMSNPSSITNKFGDITKLFPFCIPFDLVRLIKGMSAEKEPPVFHFEHEFKTIDYTFVVDVDLSDYDKYIKLFRYGMQIFYILALMFLTAKISTYFA